MIRRFPPQSIPLYGVEVNGRRSNFTFTSRPAADQHAVLVGGVVVTIVPYLRTDDMDDPMAVGVAGGE